LSAHHSLGDLFVYFGVIKATINMYNSNYGNRGLSAYGQQQVRPVNLNRQSPALQTQLPELKPPVGARGQDIMIIWDFQVSIWCPWPVSVPVATPSPSSYPDALLKPLYCRM
jgi:hypothetical protein